MKFYAFSVLTFVVVICSFATSQSDQNNKTTRKYQCKPTDRFCVQKIAEEAHQREDNAKIILTKEDGPIYDGEMRSDSCCLCCAIQP